MNIGYLKPINIVGSAEIYVTVEQIRQGWVRIAEAPKMPVRISPAEIPIAEPLKTMVFEIHLLRRIKDKEVFEMYLMKPVDWDVADLPIDLHNY